MREWDGWEWDPEEMEPVDCGQTGQDGKQFVRGLLQGRQARQARQVVRLARKERGRGLGLGLAWMGVPEVFVKWRRGRPPGSVGAACRLLFIGSCTSAALVVEFPRGSMNFFFFLPRSLLRSATGAPSRSSAQEGEGQRECVCVCEGVPGGASIRCVQSSARVRASLCWGRVLAPPRRVPE